MISDRERIAELEEELRQVRAAFAPELDVPLDWHLPRGQRLVLQALLACSVFTSAQFYGYVWGRPGRSERRNLYTTICRLRRFLKPYRIEITTIPSVGYALRPEHKARLRAVIDYKLQQRAA